MTIQVVILAAGQGKRMYSDQPKVLHHLAGKPLLEHVIETALSLSPNTQPIVVFGHQGKKLQDKLKHHHVKWVEQAEQLGTGHALMQALPLIPDESRVLILCGDVPLITLDTLQKLNDETPVHALGMLTAHIHNPYGYGRIIRDEKKNVVKIVEEKDATDKERTVSEINAGVYLIPASYLKTWLPAIKNQNAQNEYYLTDMLMFAVQEHIPICTVQPTVTEEILGVNNRVQLAHLERFYQRQAAEKWMQHGVTLYDPARFDVRGDVKMGRDVIIDVNVILEGRVIIGDGCFIGANTILRDVEMGNHVDVKANSSIEGAKIADHCEIGPYARIRPETILSEKVRIGNFVEIKKSTIGQGSKVNHLSYIGDSEIGKQVNVGAGTITCNYDGANKHKTIIGDHAFIGSDTQLVAPVTVGEGATIGAGSTITRDTPPHKLTLSRVAQHTVDEWVQPRKKEN